MTQIATLAPTPAAGISPDRARADYLARCLERIRAAILAGARGPISHRTALNEIARILDRIPPQI